ncbi:ABC transporter ATP-binding protein [Gammaproteobacteria bacterium]|nr:ABC transporter ATP-binding protein [Gammaproteobacteria bacterium]MDA9131624.1 ABC transporter ATP-binding protein [Gammaproteobacteria bacterium]MDA9979239.1 ABC transporter ATP-binding protein [Gammaproteobacteria bacterium]MDB4243396.1 ABC transporter ATP-binding protein [Gammaproteobacteria bacterium]MDB9907548.1 ABC transporter ATP-binding protein [Gammaproteobacteria bacterium]
MNIISVDRLLKTYPDPENPKVFFNAVDSISFNIKSGEVYGLLGPNGAGKTSTLEMLEGMNDIDGGSALINGLDVSQNSYEVKKIIGVQLQANEYFDRLNLIELLILFGKLYSQEINPIKLLQGVNLAEKANAKPEELSGGQKQRFSIACALVNNPKVLFLDEPTTGLDPQAKRNLWQLIKNLNSDGMTIVLTTHNMEEAEYLCDRIAIMDKGKIVAEDTPQNLILKYAPEPPQAALHGNIEDVFLALTGHELRD